MTETLRKYKKRSKDKYTTQSIYIPVSLKERIEILSVKCLVSFNAWVVKALEQKAYKHTDHSKLSKIDNKRLDSASSASGKE